MTHTANQLLTYHTVRGGLEGSQMAKILLIDDDPIFIEQVKPALEAEGYEVLTAESGPAGLVIAAKHSPDLVILDLTMPVMDGFETCRRLLALDVRSVLVTGAWHEPRSVVRALEVGADAYLETPIKVPVLLARIRSLLRRNQRGGNNHKEVSIYDDGRLLIDLARRKVEVDGKPVRLTPTEFRLLSVLVRSPGRVVPHSELIREVWGVERTNSSASLKVYIHGLRRKLEEKPTDPSYLLAEWGIGYRFANRSP